MVVLSTTWLRSSHIAGDSSLTTTARPGRTGRPATVPPVFILASSTAISVDLPDFHRLVSRVRLPGAR